MNEKKSLESVDWVDREGSVDVEVLAGNPFSFYIATAFGGLFRETVSSK